MDDALLMTFKKMIKTLYNSNFMGFHDDLISPSTPHKELVDD